MGAEIYKVAFDFFFSPKISFFLRAALFVKRFYSKQREKEVALQSKQNEENLEPSEPMNPRPLTPSAAGSDACPRLNGV